MWTIDRFREVSLALRPANPIIQHHCTFVFDKRRLVAIGTNKLKTSPKNLKYRYTDKQSGRSISSEVMLHSELDSVVKLGERNDYDSLVFVNTRINKHGNLSMAKPCSGCAHMFSQIGYKKLYYSTNCGKMVEY